MRERLRATYGKPVMEVHGRPLDELVLTVLSQSTNDRNRDVAFQRLRARMPSWELVRDAPLRDVEEAIRPGGISVVKSRRIQALLHAIGDPLDLQWLRDIPVPEAQAFLCSLPGVGRKTAACVL
ncbi:MAG: DNA lyase, partial [Solirubrobacterales bacterium]